MSEKAKGRLYGIANSNRRGSDLWGKNQFNSTFPAALSCYMRDKGIPAVYLNVANDGSISNDEIDFDHVFNSELPNSELYFNFEASFEPFSSVVIGPSERVDLVVGQAVQNGGASSPGQQYRALEVKLTVVPDSSTCGKEEKEWGPEIVIRPATTKYCAMSMAYALRYRREEIREILESQFAGVQDWGNQSECLGILETVLEKLIEFEKLFSETQVPLVLQPVWKTKGKSPDLADDCFDVFVWSNFAIARMIIDQARSCVGATSISRWARSALQITRFLLEFSRSGNAHISSIFSHMTYGFQSDKAFSINGTRSRQYITSSRVFAPRLPKAALMDIVLDEGAVNLSPERRFDQSILIEALKQEIEALTLELSTLRNRQ